MELVTTADGSHTLYSPRFNEIYHSRHGAIQESQHVFIKHGLQHVPDNPVHIFEMGFGTGLNALLTILEAEKNNRTVYYETIEQYPVGIELIKSLNYTRQLGYEFCYGPYHTLHLCRWNEAHTVTPSFSFKKVEGALQTHYLTPGYFHVIYFDAFAPGHQPEMWTPAVFEKMYHSMTPGGVLVTYCSKSIVQKAMKEAGFMVEKLPGPPGKREMLRAHKV